MDEIFISNEMSINNSNINSSLNSSGEQSCINNKNNIMTNNVNYNEIWIKIINKIHDNSFTLREYKKTGSLFLREKKNEIISEIEMITRDIKELELQNNNVPSSISNNNSNNRNTIKLQSNPNSSNLPTVISLDMFNMPPVVKVLHSLRTNPIILTDCLENRMRLGRGQTLEHTELADFITRAIFSGCLSELEERLHLELVECVLIREFENDPSMFDPANEYFSLNLLSSYVSYTFGKLFINSVKSPIVSISQYPLLSLDTNQVTNEILNYNEIEDQSSPMFSSHSTSDINQFRTQIFQEEMAKFLLEIFDKFYLIPYALRWFTKKCLDLMNQYDPCTSREESNDRLRYVVVHIIFSAYIIPELVKPNNVYMITGQIVTQNIKHNLRLLSDRMRFYIENPDSIPDHLNKTHNLKEKIFEFCNEIIKVDNLNQYFKETYETNSNLDIKLLLSNYDLKKIIDIVVWDNSLDFKRLSLQNSIKVIKEIPCLSEKGIVLFWVNSYPNAKPKTVIGLHRARIIQEREQQLKQSLTMSRLSMSSTGLSEEELEKRNISALVNGLKSLFLQFDRAQCGFSTNSLSGLILSRQSRLPLTDNATHNQFAEILKLLDRAPSHVKENNYYSVAKSLLDEIDGNSEKENEECMKQIRLIDQLDQYKRRLLNRKHQIFCSIFFFNSTITSEIDEFIPIIKGVSEGLRYCSCKEIYLMNHCDEEYLCDYCITLKGTINKLFEKINKSMKEIQDQINNSSEYIDTTGSFIYSTFKRKLMINLYSSLFHFSKLNINFQMSLNSKINIPNYLENFIRDEIPEKYIDSNKWIRAANELKKMNHLRSPDDMLKCIKDTSSTLIKVYAISHGGYEPDQLISIIAYIILSSRIENIISHIQYICLYADIGEDEKDLPRFIDAIVYLMNRMCSKSAKSCSNIRRSFQLSFDQSTLDSLRDKSIGISGGSDDQYTDRNSIDNSRD